jgi:hypothetical protein
MKEKHITRIVQEIITRIIILMVLVLCGTAQYSLKLFYHKNSNCPKLALGYEDYETNVSKNFAKIDKYAGILQRGNQFHMDFSPNLQ